MNPKRHVVLVGLLAAASILAVGCASPGEEPAADRAAADQAAGDEKATESGPPAPGTATSVGAASNVAEGGRSTPVLARGPFWRDAELAHKIGLDERQISSMETRRQAVLGQQRAERQAATELRGELTRRLAAGDWDGARRLGEQLAAQAKAAVDRDLELKIDIVRGLDAGQREALMTERPGALRRSWLLPTPAPGGPAGELNPLLDRDPRSAGPHAGG